MCISACLKTYSHDATEILQENYSIYRWEYLLNYGMYLQAIIKEKSMNKSC